MPGVSLFISIFSRCKEQIDRWILNLLRIPWCSWCSWNVKFIQGRLAKSKIFRGALPILLVSARGPGRNPRCKRNARKSIQERINFKLALRY